MHFSRQVVIGFSLIAVLAGGLALAVGSGPTFSGGQNPRMRMAVDLKIPVLKVPNNGSAYIADFQQDLFTVPAGTVGEFALVLTHAALLNPPLFDPQYPSYFATKYCLTADSVAVQCYTPVGQFESLSSNYNPAYSGARLFDLGPFPPGTKIGVSLAATTAGELTKMPIGSNVKIAIELTGTLYRK